MLDRLVSKRATEVENEYFRLMQPAAPRGERVCGVFINATTTRHFMAASILVRVMSTSVGSRQSTKRLTSDRGM